MRIAVIGGGLLGRILTLELFERGRNVTLYEKGESSGSSACGFVGLGMMSPWSELPYYPPNAWDTFSYGVSSLSLWKNLLKKLNLSQPYFNKGVLLLARREEKQLLENLKTRFNLDCVQSHFQNLSDEEIASYEPEISSHFPQGIYLPEEGCLYPKEIFIALTEYFEKNKIPVYYNCGPCKIKNQSEVHIPMYGDVYQKFDFVFDTRGLGAKTENNELRGVRGEIIDLYAPQVNISRCVRVCDSKFPLYILPRGNHHYSLGATFIECEENKPVTVRSVLELLSMARFVHEGFMEAQILKTSVQWRPAYVDNLIKIEATNHSMSVNGLFRHGILCAPAVALRAVDLSFPSS